MPWSEIRPGKWQRPIGEHETFNKLVGDAGHAIGREQWAINCTISVTPIGILTHADLPSLFLSAWKFLRFEHPSIAAYLVDDNTLGYEIPNATSLDNWGSETFHTITDETADDVAARIQPSRYATLTYLQKTNELLFHTAHWRTDGIGIFMFLDRFLSLAAEDPMASPHILHWGEEAARLTLSIEEAAHMPATPSDVQRALAQKCIEASHAAAGAVGIRYQGSTATVPAGTRTARLALTEMETRLVGQACKDRCISLAAAVHASVAGANYFMAAAENQHRHYTSTMRFSFRPYLPEKYFEPGYACGLYSTSWMKTVPAYASWTERAMAYHKEYNKGFSAEYVSAHREYAVGLGNLIRNIPQDGETPSNVDFSSVGTLEMFVEREKGTAKREMRIDSVSIGIEVLTRQCLCIVGTFRDKLHLNIMYNDSFHEKADMIEFARTVKSILLRELGV